MNVPTLHSVLKLIPEPEYHIKDDVINGSNLDIRKTIHSRFSEAVRQTKKASQLFKGGSKMDEAKRVWLFFKKYFVYQPDPKKRQWVQLPAMAFRRMTFDCKSFALNIAAILYNLGFEIVFHYANYPKSLNAFVPSHAYTGFVLDNKIIPVDGVYRAFAKEKKFTKKWIYKIKK